MNKEVRDFFIKEIRETLNPIYRDNLENELEALKCSIKKPDMKIVEAYYDSKRK